MQTEHPKARRQIITIERATNKRSTDSVKGAFAHPERKRPSREQELNKEKGRVTHRVLTQYRNQKGKRHSQSANSVP